MQMWCVTSGYFGLISTDVTQVSVWKPVGTTTSSHSKTLFLVLAGTSIVEPFTMTSGSIIQPFGHLTGSGASRWSPSGAPKSAHLAKVSISVLPSDRSFVKCPWSGSANHGGIFRINTASLIAFAQGRVSLYVRNDIGAICPGRWQP